MRLAPAARASLLLLAVVASGGCASRAGEAAPETAAGPAATTVVGDPDGRPSRDLITRAEIERTHLTTAYDVVQRLRPAFLRTRDTGTLNAPPSYAIVYLDGTQFGGLDALRRLNTADIESIRYLSGPEATLRFGTGHDGGAILVQTRR